MSGPESEPARQRTDDPLADLGPEDFAGRTTFRQLSVEQKLLWLAHAASFALEARQSRAESTPSSERGSADRSPR